MKILFDCRYTRFPRHDGISRYTARLVEELARLHPVTMMIHDERQLPMLPDLPWVKGPHARGPLEPLAALFVNRFRPDVVFSPMQTIGPWGRRYTLVTTVHDLIYYRHRTPPRNLAWPVRLIWRAYHLTWFFQRRLLRNADAHLTDSHTTRALLAEHELSERPVTVVWLGTDLPARTPVRPLPATRDLVYMGSFMPYKNVDLLVRGMRLLPEHRLHVVSGIDAAERARLESLRGEGDVVFHDGIDDEAYRPLLAGAVALVSASRDEGFGLPIVEAMAEGTPVVVSDIPIFRETAADAGGFFDPDSPESFAAAVRELDDARVWHARSVAAAERSRGFDWAEAARTLLEVLTETHRRRVGG